jgi:hypothetical protein
VFVINLHHLCSLYTSFHSYICIHTLNKITPNTPWNQESCIWSVKILPWLVIKLESFGTLTVPKQCYKGRRYFKSQSEQQSLRSQLPVADNSEGSLDPLQLSLSIILIWLTLELQGSFRIRVMPVCVCFTLVDIIWILYIFLSLSDWYSSFYHFSQFIWVLILQTWPHTVRSLCNMILSWVCLGQVRGH